MGRPAESPLFSIKAIVKVDYKLEVKNNVPKSKSFLLNPLYSFNGFVSMFSATNGAFLSSLDAASTNGIASPVVVNGTLYFSDEYGAYAYSIPKISS